MPSQKSGDAAGFQLVVARQPFQPFGSRVHANHVAVEFDQEPAQRLCDVAGAEDHDVPGEFLPVHLEKQRQFAAAGHPEVLLQVVALKVGAHGLIALEKFERLLLTRRFERSSAHGPVRKALPGEDRPRADDLRNAAARIDDRGDAKGNSLVLQAFDLPDEAAVEHLRSWSAA